MAELFPLEIVAVNSTFISPLPRVTLAFTAPGVVVNVIAPLSAVHEILLPNRPSAGSVKFLSAVSCTSICAASYFTDAASVL